ncbi:hypothetical protein AA313_de0203976 [Arthrobotrys entomopaga]|nr:hypothetical protein AA313_de0203976 [Arthrobotrys entomopaga]
MPDLSDEDEVKESGEGMIRESGSMFKKGEEVAGNGMWEDEDQRRFYEDLIDLRARVPSILLDEGRKATSGSDKKEEDANKADAPDTADEELAAKTGDLDLNADSADRDVTIANKTVGAQVDALLIRLPSLTNRDLIDSFAYDFCFLNSKASRNRLIKILEDIPKGRADLLPYYARLIASLSKAGLTDIASAMITYLDKEFRSLQKRKEKEQLSAVRSQLETLQRKKDAHHLGPQDRISIENAFYYVNPPERPSIVAKERSPSELYVRKLIYLDLNKKNYNKTIKSLRKLHWEDREIVHMLVKVCTKIWKVRYSNVFLIAILVFGLFRYHQDFGIRVVDGVLENIRLGLEENDYRMNQRRIATIKYLGELYNYKMIDSPVIFDTLYLILSFGYEGSPRPGMYNPLDPPDNHFRIRLVCTLLDTCGECFDRGSSKKKLDFFLAFFQYYIHLKERTPMDIEFMIQDTFQLVRPNWVLHTSLEEAGKAFQEATAKIYGPAEAADDDSSTTEEAANSEMDEDAEIKLSDDEMDIEAEPPKDANNDIEGNDDEESNSDDDSSDSGDLDDEGIVYSRPQEYRDPEGEADFDREFAMLMAESLESRKFERKTVFDVPLPIKKSAVVPTIAQPPGVITMSMIEDDEDEAPPPPSQKPGIMTFSLLTKKGNKQQTREIELPSDSTFAVAMKTKQEAEREERQRIKDRVLHYERMEEEPAPLEPQRPNTNGANLKYGDKNKTARGKKLQLGDFNWYDENPNHRKPLHTQPRQSNMRGSNGESSTSSEDRSSSFALASLIQQKKEQVGSRDDQILIACDDETQKGIPQKEQKGIKLENEMKKALPAVNRGQAPSSSQIAENVATPKKNKKTASQPKFQNQQRGNFGHMRGGQKIRGGFNGSSVRQLTNQNHRGGGVLPNTGRNNTNRGRGSGNFQPYGKQLQQQQQQRLSRPRHDSPGNNGDGGMKALENIRLSSDAQDLLPLGRTRIGKSAKDVPEKTAPLPQLMINDSNWPELGKK